MALIEIKNCTECSHFRVHADDYCEINEKSVPNTKVHGVPDWCPLNPERERPEAELDVYLVTATIQKTIVATCEDDARRQFHDYELPDETSRDVDVSAVVVYVSSDGVVDLNRLPDHDVYHDNITIREYVDKEG